MLAFLELCQSGFRVVGFTVVGFTYDGVGDVDGWCVGSIVALVGVGVPPGVADVTKRWLVQVHVQFTAVTHACR